MKILGLDPKESLGFVIAQTYNLPGKTISKGTFVTSEIVAYFEEGDVQNILCAVPDNGDIHEDEAANIISCLLYTSPSPRDRTRSRMPSSA